MSVILVYDADFFHYSSVIPNLECAKYSAWRKKHKDIISFNNNLNPDLYTKTFYRKEYDDGQFDEQILNPTVEYGGRAFSEQYKQFDLEMEQIEPDFEIYKKYENLYTQGYKTKAEQFKTILYATHARISLDGINIAPFPYNRLRPKHPSIILHDYDLGAVPNSFEFILDLTQRRKTGLPYRIGNKYPINIYNFQDLKKWISIPPMGSCFYLQYNGLIEEENFIELVSHPYLGLRQMFYNVAYGCSDENDFIQNVLPLFYKQMVFLRSLNLKILLNIDENFFKTPELFNLMKLISCYYGKTYTLKYIQPQKQTLYGYCSWKRWPYIEVLPWYKITVTQQQMRESFQYMRKNNYEVFDMFYSVPNVIVSGGKLINEWERNKI